MKRFVFCILILSSWIMTGCQSTSSKVSLAETIGGYYPTHKGYVLVLPPSGCQGCMRRTYDFISAHDDSLLTVVSDSKKYIQSINGAKNRRGTVAKDLNYGMFPMLYYVDKGKVVTRFELDSYCVVQELYELDHILNHKEVDRDDIVYRYSQVRIKPRMTQGTFVEAIKGLDYSMPLVASHEILICFVVGVDGKVKDVDIKEHMEEQDYSYLVDQIYKIGPWTPGQDGAFPSPVSIMFPVTLKKQSESNT
ncbi:hypothetical protein K5X82_04615 [Halosquirtibacter xylanolyticus]|uniref:hypothetical protein n=1 Tax=Halosquirtibacter xylanolyticus TaxID=3374599 RepID=UPI0037487999|nr:hypothetical protein K5X82_04615 [Prolixibacteraceae bacterium]